MRRIFKFNRSPIIPRLIFLAILAIEYSPCYSFNLDISKNNFTYYSINDNDPLSIYPTYKLDNLFKTTLKELSNLGISEYEKDKVFLEFLKKQVLLIEELNELLFSDQNYERYNELAYEGSVPDELTIRFRDKMESCGLSILASEASIYFDVNVLYIKKMFSKELSVDMSMLFDSYGKEIQDPCCEDGGIVISLDELNNRALNWEKLSDKYFDLQLGDSRVKKYYDFYIGCLLLGMDNTPAFDHNKKLEKSFSDTYTKLIQEYPESKTAAILIDYKTILISNNNILTDDVWDFIKKH